MVKCSGCTTGGRYPEQLSDSQLLETSQSVLLW